MPKCSIVILSGTCCNPALKKVDTDLLDTMDKAASQLGIELTVKSVSIASMVIGGFNEGFGEKLGTEMRAILQEKGMGALPVMIINGSVAWYGNVPSFEKACELLKKHAD